MDNKNKESIEVDVSVKTIEVKTDPTVYVFQISCESHSAVWKETARTKREAEMFLRGMKAMASLGEIKEPNMPSEIIWEDS